MHLTPAFILPFSDTVKHGCTHLVCYKFSAKTCTGCALNLPVHCWHTLAVSVMAFTSLGFQLVAEVHYIYSSILWSVSLNSRLSLFQKEKGERWLFPLAKNGVLN